MSTPAPRFHQCNIDKYIEHYHAGRNEKIDGSNGVTVQFNETQKSAIQNICRDENIAASKFIREMVDTYFDLWPHLEIIREFKPHMETIAHNKNLLIDLLTRLSKKF